jgi:hypothetical protein
MLYNSPVEQEQVYEFVTLLKLHEPPFWHGEELHVLLVVLWHNDPLKPDKQLHC